MSHVVTVKTEIRDAEAVRAACRRQHLPNPHHGTAKLFSAEATGLIVQLPKWRYPVVCDTTSGQVAFDNYEGRWGDPQQLDAFLQAYAIEKVHIESRKNGHNLTEQPLADGRVKLTVQVGGAA